MNETLNATQKGRLNRQGNTVIPPAAWKVYLFICSEADKGHTCTIREISKAMWWKSATHAAWLQCQRLHDAGLISMETCKEKVKSRTIRPLYVVRLFREPPCEQTKHKERFMSKPTDMWAVLELMGHVRIAGRVTEEERFGGKLGRIDVPTKEGGFTTQFFNASSIYRLTPTSEEVARNVALNCQPQPVHSWELPKPAIAHTLDGDDKDEENDCDSEVDDFSPILDDPR